MSWLGCTAEEPPPIVLPDPPVLPTPPTQGPPSWVRQSEHGTLTLRREGPSHVQPQRLNVAAVFGPALDELAFPATCSLDGHLCVEPDAPLYLDRFEPLGVPAVERYSWLGDTLALGAHQVPFTVLPDDSEPAGYRGLLSLDVPLVQTLQVHFDEGEWDQGSFDVAVPELLTGLYPPPEDYVVVDATGIQQFSWAPRGGELYLSMTGETWSSVRRIEDSGSVWVDTRDFRLGEPVQVRLTRVVEQGEVEVGSHRVTVRGMAEQSWCLTDGCPDLPYAFYPSHLDFEFCWNNVNCQPSRWRLHDDGTWSSGNFTGTWTFDCCSKTIELTFVSGTRYWAQLTDEGCYEGEMLSWSGARGTWNSCFGPL